VGGLKKVVDLLTDNENNSIDLKELFAILIGDGYEEYIEKVKDTISD
jgi:hypothetical protein